MTIDDDLLIEYIRTRQAPIESIFGIKIHNDVYAGQFVSLHPEEAIVRVVNFDNTLTCPRIQEDTLRRMGRPLFVVTNPDECAVANGVHQVTRGVYMLDFDKTRLTYIGAEAVKTSRHEIH